MGISRQDCVCCDDCLGVIRASPKSNVKCEWCNKDITNCEEGYANGWRIYLREEVRKGERPCRDLCVSSCEIGYDAKRFCNLFCLHKWVTEEVTVRRA